MSATHTAAETAIMQRAMSTVRKPELIELLIADDPEAWRALGFTVDAKNNLDLGGVRLRFVDGDGGIAGWSFDLTTQDGEIDGLNTPVPSIRLPPPFLTHPNGATGLDQVIVFTGDFTRTSDALEQAGLALKRTEETAYGHTGFLRIGRSILELVGRPAAEGGEARFWGIAVVVISLEQLAAQLGDKLGPIRPAVQQGRKIAILDTGLAGVKASVAFMSPEPP
jgi:hypothetical protein